MATYAKSGDVIAIVLSKAEANALMRLAETGDSHTNKSRMNGSQRDAMDRALRTITIACTPGSRSGAAIT